jgi:hypothetical protein
MNNSKTGPAAPEDLADLRRRAAKARQLSADFDALACNLEARVAAREAANRGDEAAAPEGL